LRVEFIMVVGIRWCIACHSGIPLAIKSEIVHP